MHGSGAMMITHVLRGAKSVRRPHSTVMMPRWWTHTICSWCAMPRVAWRHMTRAVRRRRLSTRIEALTCWGEVNAWCHAVTGRLASCRGIGQRERLVELFGSRPRRLGLVVRGARRLLLLHRRRWHQRVWLHAHSRIHSLRCWESR